MGLSCSCDYGGMGILHELDPLQYWAGAQGEGLRNIAMVDMNYGS